MGDPGAAGPAHHSPASRLWSCYFVLVTSVKPSPVRRPVAALTPKPQVVAGSPCTHLLRAKRASPVPWRYFLSFPDPVPAEAAALAAVLSSRERHSSHTSLPAWHLRATSQHLLSFCLWEPERPHSSARPHGEQSGPIAVHIPRGAERPHSSARPTGNPSPHSSARLVRGTHQGLLSLKQRSRLQREVDRRGSVAAQSPCMSRNSRIRT